MEHLHGMNRHLALSLVLALAAPVGAQTTPGYSPQSAATERVGTLEVSLAATPHGRNAGTGADP